MPLAIFDLDNTLLAGDSDYLWGAFLVDQGIVDATEYANENHRFHQDYQAGKLDIQAFLTFQLRPLARHAPEQLFAWREQYLQAWIDPIILPAGQALLRKHQQAGDTLLIITATNRFITGPIAKRLGVAHLLATEVESQAGRFTGRSVGEPCFREGKINRLRAWMAEQGIDNLEQSWFYSDSHNDLPLLRLVDHPVAVDPDATLRQEAERRAWPCISLREL